ncbi:MAG: hypothetical protein AB7H93_14570 [Vicinamibacterales bacterium]
MRVVRRHLRLGAATWLMCHVLAFSALLPRDCCAAHAHAAPVAAVDHSAHSGHAMPAAAAGHEHHAAAVPDEGAACPMRAADGAPCPMHDGGGSTAPATCQMTGVCNQPAAALAAVLLQSAVPPVVFALLPAETAVTLAAAADGQPLALAVPPDSPPPRL